MLFSHVFPIKCFTENLYNLQVIYDSQVISFVIDVLPNFLSTQKNNFIGKIGNTFLYYGSELMMTNP